MNKDIVLPGGFALRGLGDIRIKILLCLIGSLGLSGCGIVEYAILKSSGKIREPTYLYVSVDRRAAAQSLSAVQPN